MTVTSGDGAVSTGLAQIAGVAPGLFAANGNGQSVAAGVAQRVGADHSQSYEPVAQFDGTRYVARPIDLGPASDLVNLVLYGTGLRFGSSLSSVTAKIGSVDVPGLYAGPAPGLVGRDQVSLSLPRSLMSRGEVAVVLAVNGKTANSVKVVVN